MLGIAPLSSSVRRHQIGTSSIRTTKLGDRTCHAISIDAIEKIRVLYPGTVAQTSMGAMVLYGDTLAVSVASSLGERKQTRISSQAVIYQPRADQWELADVLTFGEAGWSDYAFALALDGSQGQASRLAVGSMNTQSGFMAGAVNI